MNKDENVITLSSARLIHNPNKQTLHRDPDTLLTQDDCITWSMLTGEQDTNILIALPTEPVPQPLWLTLKQNANLTTSGPLTQVPYNAPWVAYVMHNKALPPYAITTLSLQRIYTAVTIDTIQRSKLDEYFDLVAIALNSKRGLDLNATNVVDTLVTLFAEDIKAYALQGFAVPSQIDSSHCPFRLYGNPSFMPHYALMSPVWHFINQTTRAYLLINALIEAGYATTENKIYVTLH